MNRLHLALLGLFLLAASRISALDAVTSKELDSCAALSDKAIQIAIYHPEEASAMQRKVALRLSALYGHEDLNHGHLPIMNRSFPAISRSIFTSVKPTPFHIPKARSA